MVSRSTSPTTISEHNINFVTCLSEMNGLILKPLNLFAKTRILMKVVRDMGIRVCTADEEAELEIAMMVRAHNASIGKESFFAYTSDTDLAINTQCK